MRLHTLNPTVRGAPPPGWILPKRIEIVESVRGFQARDIKLVCGCGPFELNVLLRDCIEAPEIEIAGQVTLSERIFEPAPDLPLALVYADTLEAAQQTSTNEFGEFDLVSSRLRACGLRLEEAGPCVLVWQGPDA